MATRCSVAVACNPDECRRTATWAVVVVLASPLLASRPPACSSNRRSFPSLAASPASVDVLDSEEVASPVDSACSPPPFVFGRPDTGNTFDHPVSVLTVAVEVPPSDSAHHGTRDTGSFDSSSRYSPSIFDDSRAACPSS